MLSNFLRKISLILRRDKIYGVLNMFGLAIGIAAAVFIFLWVEDEFTYNHHFKNRDRIYKVMQTMEYAGTTYVFPASPPVLAEAIQAEIPDVMNVARVFSQGKAAMKLDDKETFETGYFCDPSFFSMLSVQFIYGSPEHAFPNVNSVVLSDKTAKKFFPEENPLGNSLLLNHVPHIVTAVVKDFPENVNYRFDYLLPLQAWQAQNSWAHDNWTGNSVETLLELNPLANVQEVSTKLINLLQTRRNSDMLGVFMYNMNDWHLYSDFDDQGKPVGAKVKLLRLFAFIALIIVILACINFMILSTAGAMKRAKEVGVLKAIGVRKMILIRRFLGETMIQTFFSLMLSIVIVFCIIPVFNQLISKNLSFNILSLNHFIAFIAIFLFCGLLSGMYPAFFLSSFKAVDVLKGLKLPTHKGTNAMRKTLLVFQFCVSICLIVCILTMYGQFLHTRDRDWGYNKDGVVTVPLNDAMLDRYYSIINETKSIPAVENAGISGDMLHVGFTMDMGSFFWQGKDMEIQLPVFITYCMTDIFSVMEIGLDAGRDFDDFSGLEKKEVIINQRMAQLMGEEGRIGGEIQFWETNYRIIGISKDHIFNNYQALRSEPLIIIGERAPNRQYLLHIKLNDRANVSSAMQTVEAILKPYAAESSFRYTVLEERVKKMMQGDLFLAKLLTVFCIVAVLISCFGFLALISFVAEQRTREIGIRKVFGASNFQMVWMLSKDFMMIVLLACILAFPVAWWVMFRWLQNFEYRMPLYWWIFALAGVVAVVLAWCTVGVQAYKAATTNPVKVIK